MKQLALDEPVIVLTAARSGSTLLRLILDAHPDLACPAETNISRICCQLASVWTVTDGANGADDLPERAREPLHDVIAAIYGDYLTRRGKTRWCDKSIGTAPTAAWFTKLYPRAKFICLYRHCMDLVYSGLEASPWGLLGYGFEQFSGPRSGSNISALVAYWIEHTGRILEFEQQNDDRCLRIHYERLVADPEAAAEEIFAFLGVDHVPGISGRCFATEPTDIGPGDHKIRATRKVTGESVGRGIRIPVAMIPPAQLKVMNHLLGELRYTPVDHAWCRSACPPTLLADRPASAAADTAAGQLPASVGGRVVLAVLENIGDVLCTRVSAALQRGLPSVDLRALDGSKAFTVVAYHTDEHTLVRSWRVDLTAGPVTELAASDGDGQADWLMSGDVETWMAVLADRANMAACLRSGALRYIDLPADGEQRGEVSEPGPDLVVRTEMRIATVREMLGLAGYPDEVGD